MSTIQRAFECDSTTGSIDRCHKSRTLLGAIILILLCASLGAIPARSQSTETAELLRRLYLTRDFAVQRAVLGRWLNGGESYTTLEPSTSLKGADDIVRFDTATGEQREILIAAADLIPPGSKEPLAIQNYEWALGMNRILIYTNSRRVWRQNTRGDYWIFDRKSKSLHKLGGDFPPSTTMFATFSPDGSRVAYVHANNIYVEDIQTGAITQLTHDGSATTINGTSDWVYEEELNLRNAFRWSPDGKRIAYWQFDTSKVRKFALLYNIGDARNVVTHIPDADYGVYPQITEIPYPEAGTPNSAVRVGVVSAAGGETRWMQVPGDPADNYIARMEWAGNPNSLLLQHINRRQDTNDVMLADANTGGVTSIHREYDDAWVDVVNDFQWLHGGKDFLWVSEQDGWRHVYIISRDGKQVRLATPGAFDVIQVVGVDPKEQWLYYIASPDNATQRYLYRCRLDSPGSAERVTPADEPGTHSYDVSPNFEWALHTYSTFDTPPVTELVRLSNHSVTRVLSDNAELRAKTKELIFQPTEFLKVDIGGGVVLDAWMIKPRNFDPSKKYPVLVQVYGEPASQTVVDRWESLFHRILARDGYIIISIDNRGTPAPKGRAWRKIVYGSIGVLSSKDQAAALQRLEHTYSFMDASRVAVWGWSGGGSNTLNLMFRSPDLYKVGMSVAPVADQRLYDTIYQERFMGLPQENVAGYHDGSPINFAEGLKGKLLIVHSPGDDNVHYQGTELLINRLVELGKPFDFMEYPGRTHGLSEGKGTQYHVYSLLARYLEDHLPPGPSPQ